MGWQLPKKRQGLLPRWPADARRALNAVELGVLTTEPDDKGQLVIDLSVAEECIQRKSVNYDRDGDNHYDNISAFIKSMRGTDPDAAVFKRINYN